MRATCPKCRTTMSAEAIDCPACGRNIGDDIVVLVGDSDTSGSGHAVPSGDVSHRQRGLGAKPLLGVVAVLVAIAVWRSTTDSGTPRSPRPTAPAAEPTPSEPLRPTVWSFQPPAVTTGTILYLSSDGDFSVVDVDAGKGSTVRLPELSSGDPPYRLLTRSDKVVFYGRAGDQTGIYVMDPDDLDSRTILGLASLFLPSAHEDRVWLVDDAFRPTQKVREVALDGTMTVPATQTPNLPVLAAVSDALVFGGPDGLEVWDPTTGRTTRTIPGQTTLIAARSDSVAACGGSCTTLMLTNLRTGRTTSVPAPPGFQFTSGVYSPSGSHLAFPAMADDGSFHLGIVDVLTGDVVVAPTTIGGPFQTLVWSPSGQWVFFAQADGHYGVYELAGAKTFLIPGPLSHPIYGMGAGSTRAP